jgi:hypothetical protein
MPGNKPTEEEKAALANQRGKVAAYIPDAEQKKAFIYAQGNAEAKGKDNYSDLSQQTFNKRNELAVLGSMKKGGRVHVTGLYKLHAGEKVVPAKKSAVAEAKKHRGK